MPTYFYAAMLDVSDLAAFPDIVPPIAEAMIQAPKMPAYGVSVEIQPQTLVMVDIHVSAKSKAEADAIAPKLFDDTQFNVIEIRFVAEYEED